MEGSNTPAQLSKEDIIKKYRKRGNYLKEHYHIQESDALKAMEEYKNESVKGLTLKQAEDIWDAAVDWARDWEEDKTPNKQQYFKDKFNHNLKQ